MTTEEAKLPAEDIVHSLAEVAHKIKKVEHARDVHLQATHGRFNLFTTLLGAHDEVRLHTRYLTHLLDPKGSHDCGPLFLDHFLNTVMQTAVRVGENPDAIKFSDLKASGCRRVTNEHYTGGLGNIDIYLEFDNAVLVIENKIWAGDQRGQLWRYAEYAKKQKKSVYLFYLTLKGHPASKESLANPDDDQDFLDEGAVALISYDDHLLKWLEKCLKETYSFININQALQQYETVVNQLLGNTLKRSDMKEIKEEIEKNPEIVRNSKQIHQALQAVEDDCVKVFFEDLTRELKAKGEGFLLERKWGDTSDPAHTGRGNVGWSLTDDVIVEYRPKHKHLFVGAFLHYKNKSPDVSSIIQDIAKAEVANVKGDIQLGADAPGDVYAWGLVQWLLYGEEECFKSDDFVFRMLDSAKRKKKVEECVKKICDFVKIVEGERGIEGNENIKGDVE